MQQSFEVGGSRFGVRSSSETLGAWVEKTLEAYRIDSEQDPRYSIVGYTAPDDGGRDGKRFNILYAGTWHTIRTLHLPSLGHAFLSAMEAMLFPERDDSIFLDCIAVPVKGKVALLPGRRLPLLNRLSRQAGRLGIQIPAAMSVALDPSTGMLIPYAPLLEVPLDPIDALRAMSSSDGPSDRFTLSEPTPVHSIAIWDEEGHLFESVSRATALRTLAGGCFNLKRLKGDALQGIERLIDEKPCYQLAPALYDDFLRGLADRA